jgi:hypothetical protein
MKQLRSVKYTLVIIALALVALALDSTRAHAAVTISAFNAQSLTTTIVVRWTTASELNNAGFNVYRNTSATGTFSKINPSLIPVSNPGSIIGSSYSYSDNSAIKGQTYYYKLESLDFSGHTQQFGPVNATIASPTATPTTVPPTATRTPTSVPSATATLAQNTPTATPVAASPTATSPAASPTDYRAAATRQPTLVAIFVAPATPTSPAPAPARAKGSSAGVPPAPNNPNAVPTQAVAQNLDKPNPLPDTSDEPDQSAVEETPAQAPLPNPLLVMLTLMGGFAMQAVIAAGAVAFYLIADKFLR